MRSTPICDFVRQYAASDAVRLHMPGHKGRTFLGCEESDITEIDGADALYAPHGVIRDSEQIASRIFGCDTFYSTEGSSLCIRAMLYLAALHTGKRTVLAARNAHQTFLTAAALLDIDVQWLHPQPNEGYHACTVTPDALNTALNRGSYGAVYLTSPDYLGNLADIEALAAVCHKHGVLLLVDNAHGAYLRFLSPSRHPMDLGADICCDSAHKTLPVLTGGAYLHVQSALHLFRHVKSAMALFGSTSPSYLLLQSLDAANVYLESFPRKLADFLPTADAVRDQLRETGYTLCGSEPLKITIRAKAYGYTGDALASVLHAQKIYPEFHDPDYLTVMFTPENSAEELQKFANVLCRVPKKEAITQTVPPYHALETVCTPRQTLFMPRETLPVEACSGKVLASYAIACPPAVPIVLCGERIDTAAVQTLQYYGVTECAVLIS